MNNNYLKTENYNLIEINKTEHIWIFVLLDSSQFYFFFVICVDLLKKISSCVYKKNNHSIEKNLKLIFLSLYERF